MAEASSVPDNANTSDPQPQPRKRRADTSKREHEPPETTVNPFPNYRPAYRVLVIEFAVLILLGIVLFGAPDGVAGVMGEVGSKVGLLSEWMFALLSPKIFRLFTRPLYLVEKITVDVAHMVI
jgi:hypothetical protein